MSTHHDNKLQNLSDAIFALNPNIRFAGVVNNMGTLVAGGMRQNVKSMEDKGLVDAFPQISFRFKLVWWVYVRGWFTWLYYLFGKL